MIIWYKDENIGIYFSKTPHLTMRYATPESTKEEIQDINDKPFINHCELKVTLQDIKNDYKYCFTIPAKYTWDGASIPKAFWSLIGAKTDAKFLIPSLIHDVLCENHEYVNNNRYFADKVFERLLYVSGVSNFKRWLMFHSVDNFQKFCNWK